MLDYLRPLKSGKGIKPRLRAALLIVASALPALAAGQVPQVEEALPSELTIYGRLNDSIERIGVTGRRTIWNLVDNASLLGFRGSRNLGQGLTAFFQVESRIRLDTGDTFLASRGSYIGMQGAYGAGRAGRFAGPVFRRIYEYISLHNNAAGSSADVLMAGTVTGNQGPPMNNGVWYTSPNFGGLRVETAYALLNEAPLPGMPQPRHVGLVATYDTAPLHIAAARADTRYTSDLGNATPSQDIAHTIGVLYRMPRLVVGGLFERAQSRLLRDEAQRSYLRLVAMIPLDRHELHLNVGRVNHRLDAKLTDDGAVQWTLAYGYNYNPQTKLYLFYTTVNNQTNGNYGFSTRLPGIDNKSVALGVRYLFSRPLDMLLPLGGQQNK